MSTFMERFLLSVLATLAVSVTVTNQMGLTRFQQLGAAVVIVGAAIFVGATVERMRPSADSARPSTAERKGVQLAPETKTLTTPEPITVAPAPRAPMKEEKSDRGVHIEQNTQGGPAAVTLGANSPITINPDVNPNAAVVTWDCRGNKRETGPSATAALQVNAVFDDSAFQQLAVLNNESRWADLLTSSQRFIQEKPGWLTPHLFASSAHLSMGNLQAGSEQFGVYERSAGPAYAGTECERLATHILSFLKSKGLR